MYQIEQSAVTAQLRALFRNDEPLPTRLPCVLTGMAPGKIFSDDPQNPTWAIVQEAYDGAIYLGGAPDQSTLARIITQLRQERLVCVVMWPDDERIDLLPPGVDEISESIDFYDRPIGNGLESYLNHIPNDCIVRRADRELIMRTQWGADDVAYHGGLDAWEEKCICFCLIRGDEILSEASAGAGIGGLREPGVVTHEAHRGNGYGTIVSARLVYEIEKLGDRTFWSCDSENHASVAIARKLGYRVEKRFRVLAWDKVG